VNADELGAIEEVGGTMVVVDPSSPGYDPEVIRLMAVVRERWKAGDKSGAELEWQKAKALAEAAWQRHVPWAKKQGKDEDAFAELWEPFKTALTNAKIVAITLGVVFLGWAVLKAKQSLTS
jgi:hypothetical protein